MMARHETNSFTYTHGAWRMPSFNSELPIYTYELYSSIRCSSLHFDDLVSMFLWRGELT